MKKVSNNLKSITNMARMPEGVDRQLVDLVTNGRTILSLDGGSEITINFCERGGGATFLFYLGGDRLLEARFLPPVASRSAHEKADPWTCKLHRPFLALSPAESAELTGVLTLLAIAYVRHRSGSSRRN